jgi:phosphoserine phosphatase
MEFKLDEFEVADKRHLVEDLRDQLQVVTELYEDLDKEIVVYNEIVVRAERFVRGLITDNEDSLESRSERFQASKRGHEILMWIRELREFLSASRVIELPKIPALDPDHEGIATQLEDLSEGA